MACVASVRGGESPIGPWCRCIMRRPASLSSSRLASGGHRLSGPTLGGRYSWARYYHPDLHRFIAEDPLGLEAGDVNLYAYAQNNPVMFNDPLGLCVVCRTKCRLIYAKNYLLCRWSAALCQTSCDEKFDPREWSACTRKCGQDFEECFRNNNAGLANCLSGCDKKPKK